ncbi:MAG: acyl-CoA carboxylase subunit beta [Acidimicrobiales bacterium]
MTPALSIHARTPGAVSAGVTDLDGRQVIMVRSDLSRQRGLLTASDGVTVATAAEMALAARLPLVIIAASTGAAVGEGIDGIHAQGLAARAVTRCSGTVPVLAAAIGPAVAGPALLLGLADHVVTTAAAYAFVSGPRMVKDFTGIGIDKYELGGSAALARHSGVASLEVDTEDDALDALAHLLAYLPDSVDVEPPRWPTDDPSDRLTPEAGTLIPPTPTGSYDVRDVACTIVDDGELLELRARWAPNLVTAVATMGGRPIGVVANQPLAVAGTLDIPASQKGARFVSFCDAFNLPLLTLVDTPGFYPGKDLEWRGMIRHGAQLAFAYARATVPRVCVVLRKAYGGAYIVMDSRYMGNDLYLAWPSAEIAVMGAKGAVEILHRNVTPEARAELEQAYDDRLLNPYVAAERGSVDAIIDPAHTRREVAAAFELLASKQERLVPRRHDNGPV